jgi:hypothetical protein
MPGEKAKRTFNVRLGLLLGCLVCLFGLSVAAAFFIGHAVYKKKVDDNDRKIVAAREDNKVLSDKNVELQDSLQKLEEKYRDLDSRYKDLASSLVLAQHAAALNARSSPSRPPPIEQPLVREGEFAAELATALNLTSSRDETTGESYLASVNIMPRNGWISDYPMTPAVIAQVRESVARSASSGYLQISEADAVGLMDNVSIAMNLPVKAGYERNSEYQSRSIGSPPATTEFVEPSVVEDYYDDNKPPVVTYYPPPLEYTYLYEWVPSPFWWEGFEFGGFFILVDFNRHHHHRQITNHVANADGTASRVNPTGGASATASRQTGSKADTTNAAYTTTPQNITSSVSAPDSGSTMRNPGSARRDIKRSMSGPRTNLEPASRSPTNDVRMFRGGQSPRLSPVDGYRGASSGVPGGGGDTGGFHGSGFGGSGHR